MLTNLSSCYSVLSFLRPHCSNMLSFFFNFSLSLSLSLSLLLCHTISHKLLPLPLTISANSFTTAIQKIPRNTRKNPATITQKPNQKTQKEPDCNQHKKIPKTSLKIPRKYQKNKNTHRKIAPKTQKINPKTPSVHTTKNSSKTQQQTTEKPSKSHCKSTAEIVCGGWHWCWLGSVVERRGFASFGLKGSKSR